jgi:hypothetical protein
MYPSAHHAPRRIPFITSLFLALCAFWIVTIAFAATVGDQVELRAMHQAGVPFHNAPGGSQKFQRVPTGTVATVIDDLAKHFHRPRAAVLSYIMQWGLSRGQTGPIDQGKSQGSVRHLYCYVKSALHEQVQKAATAAGVKTASWLRHMVRQITITDFRKSWQEGRSEERSYDSCDDDTRFMLRLDPISRTKLQALVDRFDVSKAKIIRRLRTQATPEDFPVSWPMKGEERSGQLARQDGAGRDRELEP